MEHFTRQHLTADLVCDRFDVGPDYENIRHLGSDDWMLFWTSDGAGLIRDSQERVLVCRRFSIALIAPGCRQHYACDPESGHWQFCWAHFQPRAQWLPLLRLPERAPGIIQHRIGDEAVLHRLDRGMQEMVEAHHGTQDHALLRAQNALERVLLDIHEHIAHPGDEHPGIERVLRHIALHCDRAHAIEELATVAGLSASRFAHLFRERVGQTPACFVERQRLGRAAELLEDCAWPIADIAAAVGYDDALYFSARFKKQFGSAPRTWRKLATSSLSSERQRARRSLRS